MSMDFSSILTSITNFFSSIGENIPQSVFGLDTSYIILGLIIIIILFWGISKSRKAKPNRELVDLMPETADQDDKPEEDESAEGNELEDGFMPSNIPTESQDIAVTQEPEEPVTMAEEIKEDEPQTQSAPPPVQEIRTASVKRKKRESTREGRKISKADFSDFSGCRLLIAEDNLINQKVINGVLNESGIDVVMADDGQFVMDILAEDSDFEIILMDAHMPRLDGFEATRLIRENPDYDHILVAALSGDTAADDIRKMKEAGMEEHLEKPLKMDALYDVMSMYFSMDETSKEAPIERAEELEISVAIDDMPCLDYDMGLEICGNDEVMYKELLKEFFIGYKDSSKKMRDALVAKDYKAAQDILIDVKGTASNLGAIQFIAITEHFLEAISNDKKEAYSALFKEYQSYLLALLKSIQAAFKA